MKITKIEHQKNKNRLNIYLDNKFAFGIFEEIAYKYNLIEGMDIDENFIDNILILEEQQKANNYALNLLNHRWRTEKEIRDKLTNKNYDENIIKNTIAYLKNQNLINDKRFAETYTEEKIRLKKLGSYRIKHELYNKGISQEIIDETIEKYCHNEYERALELAKKKITSYKNDDKNAIYRKLGGYLQRRGYSYDCISSILRELL